MLRGKWFGVVARRARIALLFAGAIATAALAASAALGSSAPTEPRSWLTYGFDAERTGFNPHETVVRVDNAHHLHRLWSRRLGGVMIAQAVEAVGVKVRGAATKVVYEGTEDGDFDALRATDGHVIWHRRLGSTMSTCNFFPNGRFGVGGAGAISMQRDGTGVIYVAGGDGSVHALSLASGAERPGWPVRQVFNPAQLQVYGGLTLVEGRLYITDAGLCDIPPYHGGVAEIDVARHRVVHRFYPAGPPSQRVSGGGIWGPGGVSVDPATGDVYAATGNALTNPQNYAYSEAIVRLSPTLHVLGYSRPELSGQDVDFGSTPVLFKPAGCPNTLLAAENKSGALFTYGIASLDAGPKQRLQLAGVTHGGFVGAAAWDPETNMLYVGNSSDSSSGPFLHGLVALKAGADCKLRLAWQRAVGRSIEIVSPPTVAGGVVYFGDGLGHTEFAFNAATGAILWHSSIISDRIVAAATVVNGMLFVPAWDDNLYAFGV